MSNHPFAPLRHRAVRLIWGASVMSDVGTWVQMVVVGTLIARESGSALQTGLVALATFVPQGLAAPFAGLLADRYDRRWVYVVSLLAQAVATSVLAVMLAADVTSAGSLSVAILLSSAAGAIGSPAYAAMVPDLVPAEELMPMVALGIYSWNAGRIVGPVLGTALNAWFGAAWTITFNGATFAAMAFAVMLVRRPFTPSGLPGTVSERLRVGVRGLRESTGCMHGIGLTFIVGVFVAPFIGLTPIYVTRVFEGSTRDVGVLSSVQGVGAIAISSIVGYFVARHGRARIIPLLLAGVAIGYVGLASAPNIAVAGAVIALLGGCSASLFIMAMSIMQRDAPDETRGRVMALGHAANGLSYGIGILQLGLVSDTLGIRSALALSPLMMMLLLVVVARRSARWRQAVDGLAAQQFSAAA